MSGWTGIFGSKTSKLKPDPRIRWFGKLPTYADYYSSSGDEKWVVEFQNWVLEGFETYLRRAREARVVGSEQLAPGHHGRLPLSCCAIRLPESGMTVLASIQDYGGDMVGRPFPLCFYVGVPTAQWPGPTSDRLVGATQVIAELFGLRSRVARFFNAPGDFKSVFDTRQADLSGLDAETSDNGWMKFAADISMADWFKASHDGPDATSLESWLEAADRWGRKIAAAESETFEPTLCFPLAPTMDMGVQVAGWLGWLESRMDLKRRTLSLLVVGGAADGMTRLIVIARGVAPEDFLLLTPLGPSSRYVDDLAREPMENDPAAVKPVPEEAAWSDFVQGKL